MTDLSEFGTPDWSFDALHEMRRSLEARVGTVDLAARHSGNEVTFSVIVKVDRKRDELAADAGLHVEMQEALSAAGCPVDRLQHVKFSFCSDERIDWGAVEQWEEHCRRVTESTVVVPCPTPA